MTPELARLFPVIEATWPPAATRDVGGWRLRDGAGGGKRISAATRLAPGADPEQAAGEMRAAGQTPLFMLRPGDEDLDARLAADGYALLDPTRLLLCDVARLTDTPIPRVTAFEIWEPLAIMVEIWARGGIGPERLAVMARAREKTAILSRWNEKPAGVAFAALHDGICMVHAVEVLPHQRRQGVAGWMMRKAAFWGAEHGAREVAVLCTEANTAARAFYCALGMRDVGAYHYRRSGEEPS